MTTSDERRPRLYKTAGIVLRQRRLGEADKIITLFTPNLGKLDAVAKGVRRPRSKLGGHVEPLSHTSFLLAKGRELDIITQAQAVELFAPVREDLDRTGRALYLVELVDRFTPERQEAYPVFRLLLESLRRLAAETSLDAVLRFFEMRLLDHLGYRPQLQECVVCGKALRPQTNNWSVESGGVSCPECARDSPMPRPLSLNALKVMRLLQTGDFADVARLRLTPALAVEIERHLREYIFYLLERDVRSARFLDTLRHTDRVAEREVRQ
ncbi:MAG: DNA repair protein RecO [Dehalococcoidia bacterium]|nr:DNA repair protein RecO [Dehalococcoidia bacterium]